MKLKNREKKIKETLVIIDKGIEHLIKLSIPEDSEAREILVVNAEEPVVSTGLNRCRQKMRSMSGQII